MKTNKTGIILTIVMAAVCLTLIGCYPTAEMAKETESSQNLRIHKARGLTLKAVEFPSARPTLEMKVLGNCPDAAFSTWQPTGLYVSKGDTLYIQADGIVNWWDDGATTPDGLGSAIKTCLLSDISCVALVGRAGDQFIVNELVSNSRRTFGPGFVGSKCKWTKTADATWGTLYLAVNDGGDNDNKGAYDVKIWIVRGGEVMSADKVGITKTK